MILLDINVLLYAYDEDSPFHQVAGAWLEELFRSKEPVGLPWVTVWGFVRIRTNSRLGEKPRTLEETFDLVRSWLSVSGVTLVDPGPRHLELLAHLAQTYGARGPVMTDAVLAALALEYGAAVASTDHDFSRFQEIRWINPLKVA